MKRILILSGVIFGVVAVVVMLAGGAARADSLPEVEFLGEGPGSFDTTLDDFIVKRDEEQYDFEAGPTYVAASGERVWAVRGTKEAPEYIFNGVVDLGWAYEGCTVEYVGIDDDVNGIRNGFFLGPNLVELVIEGMVFEGSYDVPTTIRDHRFVAEESVAGWYTPCEEPEATPPPGDNVVVFLPAIFNPGGEQPPATETPPPDATATTVPPTATSAPPTTTTEAPPEYDVICDQEYEINIVDEEIHFQFAATAFEDGIPLEDVDLKGTLDTGSQTPSNIENTNFNGVADFTITVFITSVEQPPIATVAFDDQGTYGNASCTVDFSAELPPTPTPTPPPPGEPELVCDQTYTVRFNDEDVEFKFAATAFYNGYPLSDVELEAELDTGGITHDSDERTNFNGVADFKMEVLVTNITQTPLVTVTFDNDDDYGNTSCTIDSGESELFWAPIIERAVNGR